MLAFHNAFCSTIIFFNFHITYNNTIFFYKISQNFIIINNSKSKFVNYFNELHMIIEYKYVYKNFKKQKIGKSISSSADYRIFLIVL